MFDEYDDREIPEAPASPTGYRAERPGMGDRRATYQNQGYADDGDGNGGGRYRSRSAMRPAAPDRRASSPGYRDRGERY